MIKFFKKIRYNLMETGKAGKYFKYAIGEIILVVVGILIALSINIWNEVKKERKSEKSILIEIWSSALEFIHSSVRLNVLDLIIQIEKEID